MQKPVITFIWHVIRVSLALLGITLIIFWFFSQRSLLELSNYLFMGGALSVLVGLILLALGWGSTESISNQEITADARGKKPERTGYTLRELLQKYDLTIQVWLAGTLLLLLSILIGQLL
jgi:hypothetical protein